MAILRDEFTSSFMRGALDSVSASAFPPDAVAELVNGRVKPDGTVETRPGTRRKHVTTLGAGRSSYGGIHFDEPVPMDVVCIGSSMFVSTNNGAIWTEVADDLHEDFWDFATMKVGGTLTLFMANGGANTYRFDGTTLDVLPNIPLNIKYLAVFNDRLWASDGRFLYASAVGDPEQWDINHGALFVQVQTHSGDKITGLYQLGPHLLVFRQHSTSYVSGFGEETLVVAAGATGLSRSVGCVGFRTIVGVGDNAVCWLSERGIERYANGQIQLLSQNLRQFFGTINRSMIAQNPGLPVAAYDPVNQEYHLAIPTGTEGNDRVVVLNLQTGALSIDRYSVATAPVETTVSLRFGFDSDGYLTLDDGGFALTTDSDWYLVIATIGGLIIEIDDGTGYLRAAPLSGGQLATLYIAPDAHGVPKVHSVGNDGFVRIHEETVKKDDALMDGTGGQDIQFLVVSRPFYAGTVRHRKRVRAIHLATLSNEAATIRVAVRAGTQTTPWRSLTMPASKLSMQPQRRKMMVSVRADAPQVEVRSTDRVRLAVLGVTVEILREPPFAA